MDDVGRMHVVTAREDLEHEVLQVIVGKVLSRVDHTVHICLHQLRNDIDIFEAGGGRWLRHIKHLDNVFMLEELKQTNLTHNSLGVDQVLEGLRNFLNRHLAVVDVIVSAADDTIGTVTDLLDELKLFFDAESGSRTDELLCAGLLCLLEWTLDDVTLSL